MQAVFEWNRLFSLLRNIFFYVVCVIRINVSVSHGLDAPKERNPEFVVHFQLSVSQMRWLAVNQSWLPRQLPEKRCKPLGFWMIFSWNLVEVVFSLLRRVDNKQRFDAFRLLVFPSARSKQTKLRRAYGCFCSAVNAFQFFLRHKWIHLDHRRRLQFWRYTILLLAKLTHRIKLRPVTLIFTVVWRIKPEWKSNMIPCALWV